ncbi:NgoMIV family type II restriction endonuclease [Actinoplanes sp. NPDC023936]|uniref:NgoMIV family type II restriction endonuclease n=1 Tax=Actinoplanes sp. NPDC023936 TaxID=3154910 RepID=UPI0033FE37E3
MPATFLDALCGFRSDPKDSETTSSNPNTSDRSDAISVALGRMLFEILGVPADRKGPTKIGEAMGHEIIGDLASRVGSGLAVGSGSATGFRQYSHLKAFSDFKRDVEKFSDFQIQEIVDAVRGLPSSPTRGDVLRKLNQLKNRLDKRNTLIARLLTNAPEESLLGLDVTISDITAEEPRELRTALSLKWSLRTDRAQDCLSQGAKLASLRRGRMPHYGVVTMEPRPYMLAILCDGSGAVDFVYHLHLEAVQEAVKRLALERGDSDRWQGVRTLERLVGQGRLRDYDDLIKETAS